MLTRRAYASVRSTVSAQHTLAVRPRSLVTSAATQSPARGPALADITPDSATSFSKKQKDFRDGLVAAQKQKEQQESASHSDHLAAPRTTAGHNSSIIGKRHGSLTSSLQKKLALVSMRAARRRAVPCLHSSTAHPRAASSTRTLSAAFPRSWLAANMSTRLSSTT